jgi:glycosyltransferase involved in cell wall biosynthesis
MCIVHVVGTLEAGGVQRLVLGLADAPDLRCHQHKVLCLFGNQGELAPQFAAAGLASARCPFPWPDRLPLPSYRLARWIRHQLTFTFPRRMAKVLRALNADLVHTHVSAGIEWQARGVLQQAKLPFVWTIHGLYKPAGTELKRWQRAVRMIQANKGSITADSSPLAADFQERGAGRLDQVRVVYAGADVNRMRDARPRDLQWRTRWGIPEGALLFGSAGRLVPEKAYDVFIKAAAQMKHEGLNVHFAIAGQGPLQRELEALIAQYQLADRFHLLGFQSDIPLILKQLDVFVLSSRSEGFPLALIEALAAGIPCIATRVGGTAEMLGDHGGLLVPSESPESLAHAMHSALDMGLRQRLAASGPGIAHQFSYESCGRHFSHIYADLLLKPAA